MKQINSLVTCCFLAVFVLVIASCSKEGPAGAAGPAGPAGAAGPTGAAGAKGDTGVANVIYSAWLDAKYTGDLNGTDTIGFYYDATVPKLTAAIINSGEIKVYVNFGSSAAPQIIPLPYWDPYYTITINPTFLVGIIDIYTNVDLSTRTATDGSGNKLLQWRYILIPGGKAARSAIDWNDYAAVKKYLNLKD
jgi:hypothetical protein